jgi:hypothetical protein
MPSGIDSHIKILFPFLLLSLTQIRQELYIIPAMVLFYEEKLRKYVILITEDLFCRICREVLREAADKGSRVISSFL